MKSTLIASILSTLLLPAGLLSAGVPATQSTGEFYVGGEVIRQGVYTIGQEHINVLMAVTAAGIKDRNSDYQITVRHVVVPHKLEQTTTFNSLKALQDLPEAAVILSANDTVTVSAIKP